MFEFTEEALDEIALSVDVSGDGPLNLSIPLGRDMSCRTYGLYLLDQGAGVISAIGHDMAGPGQAGDQLGTDTLV